MSKADIPRLINALEGTRSNPQNDNWRAQAQVLASFTEFSRDVAGIVLAYERADDRATALIDRLKRREGGE